MSEILKADFSNAKIGDRVKNNRGVRGEVTYIKETSLNEHPLRVLFFNDENETCLTIDGKYSDDNRYPSVWYDYKGQFPTIEACTRPLPKIEVDEKVLVYWLDGQKVKRYFKKYGDFGGIDVFGKGCTSWNSENYENFKYWKLASDPTINSGNLDEIEN